MTIKKLIQTILLGFMLCFCGSMARNLSKIPTDRPVVLYCSSGYRSGMGVMTLHLFDKWIEGHMRHLRIRSLHGVMAVLLALFTGCVVSLDGNGVWGSGIVRTES